MITILLSRATAIELGYFPYDLDSAANFVPLNTADNWLHLGLAVGMLALGLVLGRTRNAPDDKRHV